MSVFALTNAGLYVAGLDLTTVTNQIQVAESVVQLDATTMQPGTSPGYVARIGGLHDIDIAHQGFGDFAGSNDPTIFGNLGTAGNVVTVSPTGADGAVAYLLQGLQAEYSPIVGDLGKIAGIAGRLKGSLKTGSVRGLIMYPKTTLSAPATGTIQQLGAVGAAQSVYASLHVFAAGTTITVQVQSAAAIGFASPTTRATFSGVSTVSGNWQSAAGAITDQYWRINVSAITGSFTIAAAIGIK